MDTGNAPAHNDHIHMEQRNKLHIRSEHLFTPITAPTCIISLFSVTLLLPVVQAGYAVAYSWGFRGQWHVCKAPWQLPHSLYCFIVELGKLFFQLCIRIWFPGGWPLAVQHILSVQYI